MNTKHKYPLCICLLFYTLLLAACGGGGGGNATTTTPDSDWDTMKWDDGNWK